jgi:plasmid stabilization system protein ParE
VQGALYYPYIRVPNNAWWTRTLLYWDSVATITPSEYIHNPSLHDPFTLDLIENELLFQVLPEEATELFIPSFERFVTLHGPEELERRRTNFHMGGVTRVHGDKLLSDFCFAWLQEQQLGQYDTGLWWLVEEATAAEFMAALALSLCEAADHGDWDRKGGRRPERWVPVTNDGPSTRAMLSGLRPVTGGAEMPVELRVRGEQRLAEIRSVVLPRVLPVPDGPVDLDDIVRFRRRHGDLLPGFRRDMEDRFQRLADLDDPVQAQREVDRLEDDVWDLVDELDTYLSEARFHAVVRSPLVSVFKLLLPAGAGEAIGIGQEVLAPGRRYADFESDPLAYLAFANAAFAPVQKYAIDPLTGIPLVSAVSHPRRRR